MFTKNIKNLTNRSNGNLMYKSQHNLSHVNMFMAATALSAFCSDFYAFAVYGSVFGFTIGAYVGLTSVILVDLLGLDHLTNAFGLLLLFQGIASLIGPPIAGWLYDAFLTYDPGFYVAGVTIAVSGIMLYIIPWLQRYLRRRRKRRETVIALT